jgi:hypothetical protein
VAAQPFHQVDAAEDQASLRPAEELVTARGDEVGALPQYGGGVRLVRQQRVRRQQPGSDVHDDGRPERDQFGHADRRGEPGDDEVRRVHLEDEPGLGADRLRVVVQGGPVGGADLAQPRPAGGQQVRDAEAVADLDQLPPAHDDLAARGQGERTQQQGRGVVVHHVHRSRVGHGRGEQGERAAPTPGPRTSDEIEFDICRLSRDRERLHRRPRQRRPAEVRVDDDAGRVDHALQAGRVRR